MAISVRTHKGRNRSTRSSRNFQTASAGEWVLTPHVASRFFNSRDCQISPISPPAHPRNHRTRILPVTATVCGRFEEGVARGWADLDFAAMVGLDGTEPSRKSS
jgi:hypothetical protein